MQSHASTLTRFFYNINIIISYPIIYKDRLSYLFVCAVALRSSPPSHVCVCNGHPGSELCCVHCNSDMLLRKRSGVLSDESAGLLKAVYGFGGSSFLLFYSFFLSVILSLFSLRLFPSSLMSYFNFLFISGDYSQ
jgi:hypothetical protein